MSDPGVLLDLLDTAIARSDRIDAVRVAPGAIAGTGALCRDLFGGGPVLVIADDNTWRAAGDALSASLEAVGLSVETHVLPGVPRVKPTRELGDLLAAAIAEDRTPVALGSGVINDLVKYAAYERGRAYLCVPTAASMDGYTSAGSPLSDRGFKKTIQCRPPRAIVADLDIIADAPPAMTGWGFGDLAGKVPAGADWVLADALGIEPIDDVAWPLVQDRLKNWLANPDALTGGDRRAIAELFTGLALVGLAMEFHGSSRPASGADHQIAHLWEMEDLVFAGERVSHGACVAVGCVATLALYDWLLDQDLGTLDIDAIVASAPSLEDKEAEIDRRFPNPQIADRAKAETREKHLPPAVHRDRLEALRQIWPATADRLKEQVLPVARMTDLLAKAGAPSDAAHIGVAPGHLRETMAGARFIRSRYTILDFLEETGLFDAALDAMFAEKVSSP
ncbi:MAG: sn-glycerol-1-phosphate dehydrogenase [Pseudomonadota bacterium]